MLNFKKFYENQNIKEKLDINLADMNHILNRGYINVWREEGTTTDYWGGKSQGYRGVYYWVGDENEEKLPLGNCLVANNKVHAAIKLGFNNKFILKKVGYYNYTPKDKRNQEEEKRKLNTYIVGEDNYGITDQFDSLIAPLAKHNGYDTIILLKEPQSSSHYFAKKTEVIDIRNVHPKSKDEIEEDS